MKHHPRLGEARIPPRDLHTTIKTPFLAAASHILWLDAAWGNLEQFFEAIFCFLLHLLLLPLAMELCCR